ncbi:MAG TPA: hypothetical protein VHN99_07685, partial [Deinococcales bacterium]|nr:hypothetical protein [Deinococcales bacterium]
FLAFLACLGLLGGGWYAYQRLTGGPPGVWVDFGSLLRLPPDAEALYVYDKPGACYRGQGMFVSITRFSNFNTQLRHTDPQPKLAIYLRNDAGQIVAIAAQDPATRLPLQVNYRQAGFTGLDGRVWSDTGEAQGKYPNLERLAVSATAGRLRVNARPVTCPEDLPPS